MRFGRLIFGTAYYQNVMVYNINRSPKTKVGSLSLLSVLKKDT